MIALKLNYICLFTNMLKKTALEVVKACLGFNSGLPSGNGNLNLVAIFVSLAM